MTTSGRRWKSCWGFWSGFDDLTSGHRFVIKAGDRVMTNKGTKAQDDAFVLDLNEVAPSMPGTMIDQA